MSFCCNSTASEGLNTNPYGLSANTDLKNFGSSARGTLEFVKQFGSTQEDLSLGVASDGSGGSQPSSSNCIT
ncbi:hypothetical protein F7734_26710 [Scytonema sp. UIC 10036]|uniref:hypothetical protein n=1 Tax=Scytonema sp. UIC 10036 TaxID=2304196 RepID=UPI0012DAA687|nr:hypothetical protein [Scytonema sp. UIC 10036]MUG95752.1 hypothetical protein [Scytonema sp. UIC 10036]